MSYRTKVIEEIERVFRDEGIEPPKEFLDDLMLLESGLDSLAFAVLVTQLQSTLGFDPFLASDEPFYPETLGEFIEFYDRHDT